MPKNRKPFYSSLRDLTRVSLRDLKPIEIEKKKHQFHMTVRQKILSVTAACILLIVITLTLGNFLAPAGSFFSTISLPFQRAFSAIGNFFEERATASRDARELREENASLKRTLEAMQYENTLQEVRLNRLNELMALYELDNQYSDYPKTAAEIIAASPSNWFSSVTINKGAADKLAAYMPVLSGSGLFGYIDTVYQKTSRVTTILSDGSFVYGEILRSMDRVSVIGTAEGEREGVCEIEFAIGQVDIAVGDEIVTSGMSTIYPPGVRIGEVIKIAEKGDGVMGIATVRPFAEIHDVTCVLIMQEVKAKPVDITNVDDQEESVSESREESVPSESGSGEVSQP